MTTTPVAVFTYHSHYGISPMLLRCEHRIERGLEFGNVARFDQLKRQFRIGGLGAVGSRR